MSNDSNFFARHMMRLAGMLFLFFILLAGCGIPVSRTTIVPKGVAETPEHLIAKLDLLKTGMEIGEVFELLPCSPLSDYLVQRGSDFAYPSIYLEKSSLYFQLKGGLYVG